MNQRYWRCYLFVCTIFLFCQLYSYSATPKPQPPPRATIEAMGITLPPDALTSDDAIGRELWNNLDQAQADQIEQQFIDLIKPALQNYFSQNSTPPTPTPMSVVPEFAYVPTGYSMPTGTGNGTMAVRPPGGSAVYSVTVNKVMGLTPFTVRLKASVSGGNSTVLSCYWNFGDGTTGKGFTVYHTYTNAGDFFPVAFIDGNAGSGSASTKLSVYPGTDSDSDGIPDYLEDKLAQFFSPSYYVSLGEHYGTGFALFQDRSDGQFTRAIYPSLPPISHYQVRPYGAINGYAYFSIDYLTLWNRDDGLFMQCDDLIDQFMIGQWLGGVGDHDLDNEHVHLLVRAPMIDGAINLDAMNYRATQLYCAAHDGTACQQSKYYRFEDRPEPPGQHAWAYLTASKHASYNFAPNGWPILPEDAIASVYTLVRIYCYTTDNPDLCYIFRSLANSLCFGCVVERHFSQGKTLELRSRINVGDVSSPASGCQFILVPDLYEILTRPYFSW